MTPERFARLRRVLDRRQPDLTVLMENVHKPHNLSAVVRSCDAVGVLEAHAVAPRENLRLYKGITGGSRSWVPVRVHRDLGEAFAALEAGGFQVLAAHPAPGSVDYRRVDYTRPTALLLGQERDGVSREAAARAHRWVAVPMLGMVASLNVSVAAAIVLFEAQRQRAAAGLYDRCRLDDDRYRETLFEWAYPELAALCRRRRAPYPELGDDGQLLGELPR